MTQKVKLKEICCLINGRAYKQDELLETGKYPVLRVGNFFSDKDFYYSDLELEPDKYCDDGDLLFAWSASFGPKIWNGGKAIYHYHIWKMLLSDRVDKNYLFYYLYYLSERIKSEGHGGIMIHTTKAEMEEREFFLPELPIQKQIANLLRNSASILAIRKQQLQKLDELVKARFIELFNNVNSPMKTVAELCSYIVDCPHTTPKYEGILKNPAIRTSEIKKGYIVWDTMKYVSDEEYLQRTARLIPKVGDIVYGREGTFGNAAILPEGYNFCLGQRVMLLRPDYSKCTSEYLLYAVISDDVYRQAAEKNNASTVAHVNVKDVRQFRVPLPSFDKQNEFAAFVMQVDKSKAAIQKALDEAQLLFDSLMQKYFG